jgi:NAD(P)H-dependent FMN reductase
MTQLIGLSGSLRSGSYNTALLHAATRLIPEGASLEVATIRNVSMTLRHSTSRFRLGCCLFSGVG